MFFVFVIFCVVSFSLNGEKLDLFALQSPSKFPKGTFHRESNTCYILFMSRGQEGPLNPSTRMQYSSGNYHRPWDWCSCHFGWLLQINARPCSVDCSCIPPAWLWHAHLNCYFSVPVVAIQMKTLGYVRNEALGLLHTDCYILNAGTFVDWTKNFITPEIKGWPHCIE